MSDSRQHHFLSQCYLNGFAILRKEGKYQIQVFDRISRSHYPTTPRNVGGERDFNRLDEGQTSDPNALEKGLAEFEGNLAPVLERVRTSAEFSSPEERAYILNMIGLFTLRNPRWRETVRSMHEQSMKMTMEAVLAKPDRWEKHISSAKEAGYVKSESGITYDEMKDFVERDEYTINLNRGYHIGLEFGGLDTLLPHLFRRKWWIVRAPKNSAGFVTCDHPVSLMWSDPAMRGKLYPPGYGLTGTQVTFPLSARLAMLGAFEIDERTDTVSEELVAQINGVVIANAQRQVYARDLNFRYQLRLAEGFRKADKLLTDRSFIAPSK